MAILDNEKINKYLKILLFIGIFLITFPSDWSCIAVFAIIFMNKYKDNFKKKMLMMMVGILMYVAVYYFCIDHFYGLLQLAAALTIPILYLYNSERGKLNLKYLFYIYYPLHLVIIGIIKIIVFGNIKLLS